MCSTQPNIPMVISFICLGVLGYSGQYPKTFTFAFISDKLCNIQYFARTGFIPPLLNTRRKL